MFNGADEINEARSAAVPIFALMERTPSIDSLATDGLKLPTITGNIIFDQINFSYPTRNKLQVRRNISMNVQNCSMLIPNMSELFQR